MPLIRVLIIEDTEDLASDAQREIEEAFDLDSEIDVIVSVESDFEAGRAKVEQGEADVVVLDVRRDSKVPSDGDKVAGHSVFLRIKQARFTPVVFWTALPEEVENEQMIPLVRVVKKEDMDLLPEAIKAAVMSRAVSTISDIEGHVATVLRKHMWTELAPHWAEYTDEADPKAVAQVLLSRLARVLDEDGEQSLAAHPSHRYLYPPTSEDRLPGDLLRTDEGWWVLLTPACDIKQKKMDFALLAKANSLKDHEKYKQWASSNVGTSNERDRMKSLRQNVLTATHGRFRYLPAFREIPDLVIDLENVKSIPAAELEAALPIASLVSPFAESLLVQYSHYRGRIGVPDLDEVWITRRLDATR